MTLGMVGEPVDQRRDGDPSPQLSAQALKVMLLETRTT